MAITDDFLLNRSDSFTLGATTETRVNLALTQAAPSTGNIRGTVTNAVGGATIAGATVKLRTEPGDPVAHTATNAAGYYIFPDIPTGTYKINVASQGFVTSGYISVTLQAAQTLIVNITLTPESRSSNVIYGTVTNQATGAVISDACAALIPDTTTLTNLNIGKSNASGQIYAQPNHRQHAKFRDFSRRILSFQFSKYHDFRRDHRPFGRSFATIFASSGDC
jgi:hypothetical protein